MIFPEFGIRTELAVAVVFPELVRYSALMDFMETTAVKALYQQKGVKGADFSIGRFQMKPSFVEDLERQWMRTEWRHEYGIYFDLSETLEAHRICVLRLDDRNWQCIYLAMFLKLLYRRFPELAEEEDIEQVRFCSTAYNASFYGTYECIRSKSARRFYHTDSRNEALRLFRDSGLLLQDSSLTCWNDFYFPPFKSFQHYVKARHKRG